MLTKVRTLRTIHESSAVLIVRLPDAEPAERVAHAAIEWGPHAIEITLSVPGAVGLIGRLAADYTSKDVAAGAGTVLDGHAAYQCISAGPSFRVSPQFNPEMIRVANRYQVATISGAFTPTELLESAEAGADILKLFPTENSTQYAKAVLAPLAHLPTVPAGVSLPPTCVSGSRREPRRSAWGAQSRRHGSPTATSPESSLLPKASSQPFRAHVRDATGSPLRHRRGRNPVRSPAIPQQRLRYRALGKDAPSSEIRGVGPRRRILGGTRKTPVL